jgi:integrase
MPLTIWRVIATVVCEQKHMGSRAVVVLCKNEAVSQTRFGVVQASLGTVYTPTGRRFFTDEASERQFLVRLQLAVEKSGLWDEFGTDWLCLDCELMPWSAKAQELLQRQYAPVGNAGVRALQAEKDLIAKATLRVPGLEILSAQTTERLGAVEHYTQAYRQYCWPVSSLADLKLAPFHLLASEGTVHNYSEHLAEFIISVNAGMRLSEQYPLAWGQIHLDRRTIDLIKPKNGSARTVHLNADSVAALESLRRKGQKATDPVFLRQGPRFDTRSWFVPCLTEANIEGYVWHSNRHTFCSWLAMAGASIKEIQELAGHKTITMSARYSHLSPEHRISVIDRISSVQ